MKIGDVANALSIPASTIRYYERVGLIAAPARVSGQRVFGDRDIRALQFIKLAQAAGFSIDEMKGIRLACDTGKSPSAVWTAVADEKQQEVRAQIAAMRDRESVLDELLSCNCGTIADCIAAADERRVNTAPRP